MPKSLIFYYSRTGNTRLMAEAVAEGIKSIQGVEAQLKTRVDARELSGFDAVIVGAPTYEHGITRNIAQMFEEAAAKNVNLEGKVGTAFGSYGWSAEAPPLVLEIMNNKFRMDTLEPPLLVKYAPDQSDLDECRQLGKKIAEKIRTKT
ncbi:MAG: flavodoxin domain-containing protein [Thermoproteota archaeon]